jgi:hypothetical protein
MVSGGGNRTAVGAPLDVLYGIMGQIKNVSNIHYIG